MILLFAEKLYANDILQSKQFNLRHNWPTVRMERKLFDRSLRSRYFRLHARHRIRRPFRHPPNGRSWGRVHGDSLSQSPIMRILTMRYAMSAVIVGLFMSCAVRAEELKAGAAKVEITPPTGYAMWGYGVAARSAERRRPRFAARSRPGPRGRDGENRHCQSRSGPGADAAIDRGHSRQDQERRHRTHFPCRLPHASRAGHRVGRLARCQDFLRPPTGTEARRCHSRSEQGAEAGPAGRGVEGSTAQSQSPLQARR